MLHPSEHKPRIAVVMSNTLACMGLKQLLLSMMPRAEVCMFGSMEGLHAAGSDDFFIISFRRISCCIMLTFSLRGAGILLCWYMAIIRFRCRRLSGP